MTATGTLLTARFRGKGWYFALPEMLWDYQELAVSPNRDISSTMFSPIDAQPAFQFILELLECLRDSNMSAVVPTDLADHAPVQRLITGRLNNYIVLRPRTKQDLNSLLSEQFAYRTVFYPRGLDVPVACLVEQEMADWSIIGDTEFLTECINTTTKALSIELKAFPERYAEVLKQRAAGLDIKAVIPFVSDSEAPGSDSSS